MSYLGDPILAVTGLISDIVSMGGDVAIAKRKMVTRQREARKQAAHEARMLAKGSKTVQEEAYLKSAASQEQDREVKKIFLLGAGGMLALAGIITVGVIMIQDKKKGGK